VEKKASAEGSHLGACADVDIACTVGNARNDVAGDVKDDEN
jgi:hypothetical protein